MIAEEESYRKFRELEKMTSLETVVMKSCLICVMTNVNMLKNFTCLRTLASSTNFRILPLTC